MFLRIIVGHDKFNWVETNRKLTVVTVKSEIFSSISVVGKVRNHGTIWIRCCPFGQQLVCNLLGCYPDMDRSKHILLVNRPIFPAPFVKFEPGLFGRNIMNTTNERQTWVVVSNCSENWRASKRSIPLGPGRGRAPGGSLLLLNLSKRITTDRTRVAPRVMSIKVMIVCFLQIFGYG